MQIEPVLMGHKRDTTLVTLFRNYQHESGGDYMRFWAENREDDLPRCLGTCNRIEH